MYISLGFPNIMVPSGVPLVNQFLVSISCGQDAVVDSLATVGSIIINCDAFNGSEPFVQEVYKDGELIQNGTSLSLLITPASDDNFGTYTFALSTEKCGSTTAVSRIIRQGQFSRFTILTEITTATFAWVVCNYHNV